MRVPLFNPNGNDRAENQLMINGPATGIANVNESKYKWANGLYNKMRENFWNHTHISMAPDKTTIKLLTEDEMNAHLDTLGFLVALDSFAVANLPNILHYLSAANVRMCVAEQIAQEALHTQSYQYIAEETLTKEQRETIYRRWDDNPLLAKRIQFLQDIGEAFINNDNDENFVRVCAANFALESIFFYQGFNYYDQLSSRKLLISTQKDISYIRIDELTHIHIFKNILKALREETDVDVDSIIVEIMGSAVDQEIKWGWHTYGDRILGISLQSTEDYCYYLGNKRLKEVGISSKFPERKNPYKHLDAHQSETGAEKKVNFFEGSVTNYDKAESLEGWDDF